ncbi:KipI antagonist [Calidithermus terrae]|uniref:KipI antagonist n=1 Tax=Calidithermus terrae TaxID=1408545 RepID=A0A399E951_9DEIN|nr:5-oxoprolinase subunit PxpB [Calidithermus terrae]RIH80366.1 KipI antagonist [Calidithermus terrae]
MPGFYLPFAQKPDPAANARLQALARALLNDPLPGVSDVVPGYVNLYVEYGDGSAEAAVRAWVERHAGAVLEPAPSRRVEVGVRYDGEDLEEVARRTGLSVAEVVELHSRATYHVYALGFTPGFAFMGDVDERLRLPRRAAPRKQVPAHRVAMAAGQTGVYPLPSPGGWHLLGTALEAVYDPRRAEPFRLQPGDRVRFRPADGPTPPVPERLELLPPEPRHPLLRVEEPGLLDLVVDAGRFRAGRFGLARSGPLDPRSARLANALVGNPPGTPLLELNLTGPVFSVLRPAVLALAGYGVEAVLDGEAVPSGQSFAVRPGQTLRFRPTPQGVRAYLAAAGGLESGRFLGSASVDLRGLVGRALRAGDVLGVAEPRAVRPGFRHPQPELPPRPRVRLLPGPQFSREALEALCARALEVGTADRMGMRLAARHEVPGGEVVSEATPLGAVQVPPGGQPIVLLNDRGTLGGYAKPALVHPADLPHLAQLRPGQQLRFVSRER